MTELILLFEFVNTLLMTALVLHGLTQTLDKKRAYPHTYTQDNSEKSDVLGSKL